MATARTQGRKYPRRARWIERRNAAFARADVKCEISGECLRIQTIGEWPKPEVKWRWARAVDHLWPERWIRRFCFAADPHVLENLYVITPKLHAQKTAIETLVYKADIVGYKRELIRLGWTEVQIDRALKAIVDSIPK